MIPLTLPGFLSSLFRNAALRKLQPAHNEPSLTISAILGWIFPRISHVGAAWLFLALPSVALAGGFAGIVLAWRRSEALREDANAMFSSLRRHFAVAVLGAGTLLAAGILLAVVAHIITD